MRESVKAIVFTVYDIVALPLTLVAALQLKALRRYGSPNFPLSKRLMMRIGVFPLIRHFYEPQFHPGDLDARFALERDLPGIDLRTASQLDFLSQFSFQAELEKFSGSCRPVLDGGQTFSLDNVAFGPGDIDCYYSIIRLKKPRTLIEIGSGCSTIVALAAIEENMREDPAYRCEFISVEPYPWFHHPAVTSVTSKVEEVGVELFQRLGKNDILFIDSSHMIRPGGDVIFEYLNILPKVSAGVYIHIHDIFTPFNYPELWVKSMHFFWNEQYMVEALLSESGTYEIVAALHYLSRNYPEQARAALPLLNLDHSKSGQSLWLLKQGPVR